VRAALVVVALCSGLAYAQPVDPATQAKADVLFERGQASYTGGRYQAAIELFKQAYDLVRDPVYLFNIAQSYRRVLDCLAAFEYYERYLNEAPGAENRVKVQQWLRELQPCVEQRREEQAAARRGEEAERQRREEAEQRQHADVGSGPEPMGTRDRGRNLRIAGLATGAIGIVGLAVGMGYSIQGGNVTDRITALCSPPNTCQWDDPGIQELHVDGERANTRALVGYVVGGLATVAGGALYVYGRTRVEAVAVMPTQGGLTVAANLRF
jgi:tetratricopeptide (TPR) repeat protein